MKRNLLYLLLFILSHLPAFAQRHKIDSLLSLLKAQKEDTNKVNTLSGLAFNFRNINPDTAILLGQQAGNLADKLGWLKGKADALNGMALGMSAKSDFSNSVKTFLTALKINEEIGNKKGQSSNLGNLGTVYYNQGDFPKALEDDSKALEICQEVGNTNGQAVNLGNIGLIYWKQGNYPKALEYDLKALKINEEIGSKIGQALNLGNIGLIYDDQGDYSKALDYDLKALKIDEQLGNKDGRARNLGNIGNVYGDQGNNPKALEYHLEALKGYRELGNKRGQALNLGNIGEIYRIMGDYSEALQYHFESLKLFNEIGSKDGAAIDYCGIGGVYAISGKFREAKIYLDSALTLSKAIGAIETIRASYIHYVTLDSAQGDYKAAFLDYKNYIVYCDSLKNEKNTKKILGQQMQYDFDKREAAAKAEQDKKDAQQKVIVWSIVSGLVLVLIFAGLIFRSLKITRKQRNLIGEQKTEVEEQKQLVEEKNKDILDSINYAKRLQDAILPPLSVIKKYLPDSFLLYTPKDIVAGDFYWMERVGDNILIAACDCTGHGVPGAMVSVVCSNALNRTVKEFRITEPGKILDKVRELVLETFEKSEGEVKDGMDISLCSINTMKQEVQWSGAFNPLWYIQEKLIKEVAPDKQPIGMHDRTVPFTTHTLKLNKGDSLYLFTDGYADQFGGFKGKKFKPSQLKELIATTASISMEEQGKILNETFQAWRGKLEQVDDVLVIGIRI